MQILDIHTHLGDLLYPQGADLIEKTGMRKRGDYLDFLERNLWPDWPILYRSPINKLTHRLTIRAGLNRNGSATRENMTQELARFGVETVVTLPVYPRVKSADLQAAYQKDKRMIPFTGIDFENMGDMESKFRQDVAQGVRGMKLHPILQRVNFDDPKMFDVVEAFSAHGFPILVHAGYAFYYLNKGEQHLEKPEFGEMAPFEELVKAFPSTPFIIGHAGLAEVNFVMERFAPYKNVYVDLSFQSVEVIKQLIIAFGGERVLYGSDWPWGGMQVAITCTEKACGDDQYLKRAIFYENAAALLKLG